MLTKKRVAGTVMLHLEDGSKKFLMCINEDKLELASTAFLEERTGLANILQLLKDAVQLDITHINLLELTNGKAQDMNVPLFVFEAKEKEQPETLPASYKWTEAKVFREAIQRYNIDGMPFF